MLATAGRDRKMNTSLHAARELAEAAPLDRPPESFRPDRLEVMNDFGNGNKIDIQPGVVFEALVGAHNGAKNLTTGVVRFAPAVKLAYHTHPTTESITLLAGRRDRGCRGTPLSTFAVRQCRDSAGRAARRRERIARSRGAACT